MYFMGKNTYLSTYLFTYLPTYHYLSTQLPSYLATYLPTYLLTYLPTYLTTKFEFVYLFKLLCNTFDRASFYFQYVIVSSRSFRFLGSIGTMAIVIAVLRLMKTVILFGTCENCSYSPIFTFFFKAFGNATFCIPNKWLFRPMGNCVSVSIPTFSDEFTA